MRKVALIGPARLLAAGLLWLGGCDSLWGAFRTPNDQNCVHNPGLCTAQQLCDPGTRQCVDKCGSSAECTRDPTKPVCLNGLCQACTDIADKKAADVQCLSRGVSGSIACVRSGPNRGQCLGCDTVADCTNDSFVCNSDNQCALVPCTRHSDCQSGVCDPYQQVEEKPGRCVPRSELLYVNNHNGGACTSGDGTSPGQAFCTLNEGVTKAVQMRRSVRVVGSTRSYGTLALGEMANRFGGRLTIYGPAGTAALPGEEPRALLGADQNLNGIELWAASGAQVTLDGLEIESSRNGVWCQPPDNQNQNVSLTLRRMVIRGVRSIGVEVDRCPLVMDRVMITGSGEGALRLRNSNYAVTNSFLIRNRGNQASPITIVNSMGLFRFNTVAHNEVSGNSSLASGIDCSHNQTIEDSIVASNMGQGSQFRECRLVRTVVGTRDDHAVMLGGTRADPSFEDPDRSDFRLKADATCCIDRAMSDPKVQTDYFGTRRPQRGGPDIGAHELP